MFLFVLGFFVILYQDNMMLLFHNIYILGMFYFQTTDVTTTSIQRDKMEHKNRYKKILRNCKNTLCRSLVYNEIREKLISYEILSREKAETIDEIPGNNGRMDKFLDELIDSDVVRTYPRFLGILKEDESKSHVVDALVTAAQKVNNPPQYVDNETYRSIIDKCSHALCQNVVFDDIKYHLIQDGILASDNVETCEKEGSNYKQMQQFIGMLVRVNLVKFYSKFESILLENKQTVALQELRRVQSEVSNEGKHLN